MLPLIIQHQLEIGIRINASKEHDRWNSHNQIWRHNITFKQISSNSSSTTIEFSVPSNTQSIEIIDAKVVPEFSLISALVLAVSLLLIIGFTVAMHNRI